MIVAPHCSIRAGQIFSPSRDMLLIMEEHLLLIFRVLGLDHFFAATRTILLSESMSVHLSRQASPAPMPVSFCLCSICPHLENFQKFFSRENWFDTSNYFLKLFLKSNVRKRQPNSRKQCRLCILCTRVLEEQTDTEVPDKKSEVNLGNAHKKNCVSCVPTILKEKCETDNPQTDSEKVKHKTGKEQTVSKKRTRIQFLSRNSTLKENTRVVTQILNFFIRFLAQKLNILSRKGQLYLCLSIFFTWRLG